MSPEVDAAIIAGCFGALTVIGTLAVQLYGTRKTSRDTKQTLKDQLAEQREQLDRTLAAQRDRTLNERFATAAEQLGSDTPAICLAGVYAMAGLADDWVENRQTCVDVLCASLRMPYVPDPGEQAPEPERLAFRASREVRHTVIRVITAHLQLDAKNPKSWQGLIFDFWGVVFDGCDFRGAKLSGGTVDFYGAEFSGGTVDFTGAHFSGGTVNFTNATFSSGTVDFTRAVFCGAAVDFTDSVFSGGTVDFTGATFSSGKVYFGTTFSGSTVTFAYATFSGADVGFRDATFSSGTVDFKGATFSHGKVWFGGATFSGSTVTFAYAKFCGGTVGFRGGGFSGGTVGFGGATFSGGLVDFSSVAEWSHPPKFDFDWDSPPPEVKLPAAVHGKSQ